MCDAICRSFRKENCLIHIRCYFAFAEMFAERAMPHQHNIVGGGMLFSGLIIVKRMALIIHNRKDRTFVQRMEFNEVFRFSRHTTWRQASWRLMANEKAAADSNDVF
jgi:hypothetical protein